MIINGEEYRSLWIEDNFVKLIDQRKLPYEFDIFTAKTVDDIVFAIKDMVVRGAPAIGAAAAYGITLSGEKVKESADKIRTTRPTAYDLFFALRYVIEKINDGENRYNAAENYVEDIINRCKKIGENGESLIKNNTKILTHCNAGALATVDYGTALSPLRFAHRKGRKFFVYVDETRPRLQGLLTAFELYHEDIKHAVIVDNAAGYFMKKGEIDMVITGADRIAKNGDFANKIGTYEKAILAYENSIPFYVAAPISTFDNSIENGSYINIEERSRNELSVVNNKTIYPNWVSVRNPAFDVTPAEYVTGYITEEGIIKDINNLNHS